MCTNSIFYIYVSSPITIFCTGINKKLKIILKKIKKLPTLFQHLSVIITNKTY